MQVNWILFAFRPGTLYGGKPVFVYLQVSYYASKLDLIRLQVTHYAGKPVFVHVQVSYTPNSKSME